jgi:hypothetical protein
MNSSKSAAARRDRVVGAVSALVFVVIVATGARPVSAAEVIGGYGGTVTTRTDGGIVAGNSFGTASFGTYTINSLGFVDVGNDGIAGSYQVGIWDASQTLLASTTVTPSSPLINGFRYAPITPVNLPNNSTFTIGALLPTNPSDPWLEAQFLVLGAGYTGAGFGQFQPSATLVYPGTLVNNSYVVVNASDVIVPEPGSLGLLVGAALLARRTRRGA